MFKRFPLFIAFFCLVLSLLIGVMSDWYRADTWRIGVTGANAQYSPLLNWGVPIMAMFILYGYWFGMLIESPVKRWFHFVEEFLTQGQKIIARTMSTVLYLLFPLAFKLDTVYLNLDLEKTSYENIKKEFFRWNSNDLEGSLYTLVLALPILMFLHWGIARLLVNKK